MNTRTTIFLILVIFVSGCVQQTAIPITARPGDKVVIGLGGIHRNANSTFNLKTSDLTVSVTDDATNTYPVRVDKVFRAYPDHTSKLTYTALDNGGNMGLVPYDGGWFAVVHLVDTSFNPLPLVEGDATLSVASPLLTNTQISVDGDFSAIRLEILSPYPPGEQQNSDYVGQFDYYQPVPEAYAVRIVESDLSAFNALGGARIVVNVSNLPEGTELLGLPASHNPWIQVGSRFISNGNGTGQIQAYILNPYGFSSTQSLQNALFEDLQIQIMPIGGYSQDPTVYTLDLANSYVFDLDGNPVTSGATLEWVDLSQ